MKIFLASTAFDEIRWATSAGIADGVLVSISMLEADLPGLDLRARVAEIARLFSVPIIMSLGTSDAGALYREARESARRSDHIMLEIPLSVESVESMHRAADDGARIAASMVFTPAQALLAAKAGAVSVLVHLASLESQGLHSTTVLREIRAVFDAHRIECELFAVSPASAAQVGLCAAAGADGVVMESRTLRAMLQHPLADQTFDDLVVPVRRGRLRSLT